MLQVLENTPDRLVVKTGVRPFHTTTATFDKSTGKVRFERTVFFWKRKPIEVPLDDIESITVVQQNMTGAQGMQFSSNNPLVQLKSGQRFWLSDAGSQAGSVQAVQPMRDFLAGTQTGAAAAAPAAEQPIVAPHPSRTYRWAAIALSSFAGRTNGYRGIRAVRPTAAGLDPAAVAVPDGAAPQRPRWRNR